MENINAPRKCGRTPLYIVWTLIKQRCLNPNNPQYRLYGACGITIHNEWKNDQKAFEKWFLENGWYPGCDTDRWPDNKGSYIPGNIRFVPRVKKSQNRRDGKLSESDIVEIKILRHHGCTQQEIADQFGVHQGTIGKILQGLSWTGIDPSQEALTESPRHVNKRSHRLTEAECHMILIRHFRDGFSRKKLAKMFNSSTCAMSRLIAGLARPEILRNFNNIKMYLRPVDQLDEPVAA